MNEKRVKLSKQSGFTLVEMAIVLVIIGLILGAVSIGRDLQRDAEYAKVKQKFVDQWASAYNAYYQRAGVVLGDDETRPQIMVNGFDFIAGSAVASGGNMAGLQGSVNAICQGQQAPSMLRAANTNLHTYFDDLGIRMPPGRAEGSEDRYVYLDSNGNPQEVQVCFQWNNPEEPAGSGNMMVIAGLTPDLARALDQMIDGKPDAQEGMFRREGVDNGTAGGPGVPWAETNQDRFGDGAGGGTGRNLDEDQIITVVANYKMNQ
ncbi:MAG: type II secretion system protein [Marinicellaceae bacterium]